MLAVSLELGFPARLGLELYYTGRQRLEANPYRQASHPYMLVGALIEKRFGHALLFSRAKISENVKQTNGIRRCLQRAASMAAGG